MQEAWFMLGPRVWCRDGHYWKRVLCRGLNLGHLTKTLFAEGQPQEPSPKTGPRQRAPRERCRHGYFSLLSAILALGKGFVECPRQRLSLPTQNFPRALCLEFLGLCRGPDKEPASSSGGAMPTLLATTTTAIVSLLHASSHAHDEDGIWNGKKNEGSRKEIWAELLRGRERQFHAGMLVCWSTKRCGWEKEQVNEGIRAASACQVILLWVYTVTVFFMWRQQKDNAGQVKWFSIDGSQWDPMSVIYSYLGV